MPLYAVWIADFETADDAMSISASTPEAAAEEFADDLWSVEGGNFDSVTCCVDSVDNRYVVEASHKPQFCAWKEEVR